MSIVVADTTTADPQSALGELQQQLGAMLPRFLLYFVSPDRDPRAVGDALKRAFDCPSIGCTTAGEFAGHRMLEGALVVMAFDAEHVESVATALVNDIHSPGDVERAYRALVERAGVTSTDQQDLLGLVLHDGLSLAEERVMATLSNLSNIPFVGGSAGDGSRFERTHVFVNGEPASGAAALALLKLRKKFDILKTQSFDVTDKVLEVTRADETERRVIELNGKPASEEYARALGVTAAELPTQFQAHPLGLIAGSEPFVRSPQRIQGTDVLFYCNVKQGTELRILNSRDIVDETAKVLDRTVLEFGRVEALVNFHCIQRTLELKQKNQGDTYAALFRPFKTAGFSTYGESYIGHINQTSVIVLFA